MMHPRILAKTGPISPFWPSPNFLLTSLPRLLPSLPDKSTLPPLINSLGGKEGPGRDGTQRITLQQLRSAAGFPSLTSRLPSSES